MHRDAERTGAGERMHNKGERMMVAVHPLYSASPLILSSYPRSSSPIICSIHLSVHPPCVVLSCLFILSIHPQHASSMMHPH
jgi:hypothetical protein